MNVIYKLFWSIMGVIMMCSSSLFAQRDYIWMFGNSGGLKFTNSSVTQVESYLKSLEACASICDVQGNLQFYTEGSIIWTKDHTVMPNGDGLTGIPNTFMTPTSSTSQGAVIVPFLADENLYYVFSIVANEFTGHYGELYYSVVDLRLNNGLGDVVPGQKGIKMASGLQEKMIPIIGNHCNIWLLTCTQSGSFHAYEINASGINTTPVVSSLGVSTASAYGCIEVNPSRSKIALADMGSQNGVKLFDFNPSSGVLSNPLTLATGVGIYDACFSPDETKLYASGGNMLYQFEVTSLNIDSINASRVFIAGVASTNLKLSPDNKIYFTSSGSTMGAINKPNLKGLACELDPMALRMNSFSVGLNMGLPNYVPVVNREDKKNVYEYNVRYVESVELLPTVTTGYNYQWENGAISYLRRVQQDGKYWVSYQVPPCSYVVDTFYVRFICKIPSINTTSSCSDSTQDGAAWVDSNFHPGTNYQYAWMNENGQTLSTSHRLENIKAGNYGLRIASATGCDTTLLFTVEGVNLKASFETDTLLCENESIIISNISDSAFVNFEWDFGDGGKSSLKNPLYIYQKEGMYNLTMYAFSSQCVDTVVTQITVDAPVESIKLVTNTDTLCVGDKARLSVDSNAAQTNLVWNIGQQNIISANESQVQWSFDKEGNYNVNLSVAYRACPDMSTQKMMYVHALPQINIGTDTSICLGSSPIKLENQFVGTPNYRYEWSTGETTSSILARSPGIYSLMATNDVGCASRVSITINKDCYIDIPNAFSPNGDGANDYFLPRKILSKGLVRYTMQIFNRWGQLLFETKQIHGLGWDGRFNEQDCVSGVYLYRIVCEYHNGATEEYNGNVTLVR